MQLNPIQRVRQLYEKYIEPGAFDEIEHAPDQFVPADIVLEENCLCITHSFINNYYPPLIAILTKSPTLQNHWVAQTLLIMNGENDKAWNLKKQLLSSNKLDLARELKFNAAVCYKNKKSSSYYDYRLKVFEKMLQNAGSAELKQYYEKEAALIAKILGRFLRNYYCWLYRNKLLKLMLGRCEDILEIELNSLHKFLELNPNDYSAYSRLIAVVRKHGCDISGQMAWLNQLQEFCQLGYTNRSSFQHIYTYRQFLMGKSGELEGGRSLKEGK